MRYNQDGVFSAVIGDLKLIMINRKSTSGGAVQGNLGTCSQYNMPNPQTLVTIPGYGANVGILGFAIDATSGKISALVPSLADYTTNNDCRCVLWYV